MTWWCEWEEVLKNKLCNNFNGSPYLSHKYLPRDFLSVTYFLELATHCSEFSWREAAVYFGGWGRVGEGESH